MKTDLEMHIGISNLQMEIDAARKKRAEEFDDMKKRVAILENEIKELKEKLGAK